MKEKMTAPEKPSGSVVADGILISDTGKIQNAKMVGDGSSPLDIMGGDLVVDLAVRDPYTKQIVTVEGVKVKRTPGTLLSGLREGQRFKVYCTSYDDLLQRRSEALEAVATGEEPVLQNNALPTQVKYRSTLDSFSDRPSPVCKKFKEQEEQAKRRMGIIHDREDLAILQGRQNGRSPGVLVHQGDGKVIMFDKSGSQFLCMDGERSTLRTPEFDTGQAKHSKEIAGYPVNMEENKVNYYVPQGTILSPQPWFVPNLTRLANTILVFCDLIDFVKTCSMAVRAMRGGGLEGSETQEIVNHANSSSFVNGLYGDNPEFADEREGKLSSKYDQYKKPWRT